MNKRVPFPIAPIMPPDPTQPSAPIPGIPGPAQWQPGQAPQSYTPISQLPQGNPPSGAEWLPVLQGGITVRLPLPQVSTFGAQPIPLPVSAGGTGRGYATPNALQVGGNPIADVPPGATGQILVGETNAPPSWLNHGLPGQLLASGGAIRDPAWVDAATLQGEPGPTGPTGPEGMQGEVGPMGPQGMQGNTGPTGAQGPPGPPVQFENLLGSFTNRDPSELPSDGYVPANWDGQNNPLQEIQFYPGQALLYTVTQDIWGFVSTAWNQVAWVNLGGAGGPPGPQGPPGVQGPQGEQGDRGTTGRPGPIGPEGPVGPQGPQGPEGAEGIQGPPGQTAILVGSFSVQDPSTLPPDGFLPADWDSPGNPPADLQLEPGQGLLETQTDDVWLFVTTATNAAGWINLGNVQGPPGPQGPQGVEGPDGPEGPMGPVAIQAVSLFYLATLGQTDFDLAVGDIYGNDYTLDGSEKLTVWLNGVKLTATSDQYAGDYTIDYPTSTVSLSQGATLRSVLSVDVELRETTFHLVVTHDQTMTGDGSVTPLSVVTATETTLGIVSVPAGSALNITANGEISVDADPGSPIMSTPGALRSGAIGQLLTIALDPDSALAVTNAVELSLTVATDAQVAAGTDNINPVTSRTLRNANFDARYLPIGGGTLTGAMYAPGVGFYAQGDPLQTTFWAMYVEPTVNTNFALLRFSETGAQLDTPLSISNPSPGVAGNAAINLAGAVLLDREPTLPMQAATKLYVDNFVTNAQQLIGAFNAATGQCIFTPESGLPPGLLPPATTVVAGHYVIVVVSGTPNVGPPETQVQAQQGDWWISSGAVWLHIEVSTPDLIASNVGVIPPVFGTNNVQTELEAILTQMQGLEDRKVQKAGDTMTGNLTIVSASPLLALYNSTGTARITARFGASDDNSYFEVFRNAGNTNLSFGYVDPAGVETIAFGIDKVGNITPSHFITFPTTTNPPSAALRSNGTKLVLWPQANPATNGNDIAIGIEPSAMWFNNAAATNQYRLYFASVLRYTFDQNNLALPAAPTAAAHATRKDYVDTAITTVTNNANSRVAKAGDTMTGQLTVNRAENTVGIELYKANRNNSACPEIRFTNNRGGSNRLGRIRCVQTGQFYAYADYGILEFWVGYGGATERRTMYCEGENLRVQSNVYANGVLLTSDANKKMDVAPVDDAEVATAFEQLKPVRYRWKPPSVPNPLAAPGQVSEGPHPDPQRLNWGFVAQDIEGGAPDLVQTHPEEGKSFDLAGVVAVLTAKIKQLEARLAAHGL